MSTIDVGPLSEPSRSRGQGKRTAPLKTVEKALNALEFLGVFGGQVGVRELAQYLGVNKSSTHRLLTTLESHGYVAQDPNTGKYQIGMRVFEVGAVVLSQTNLRAAARPHLEKLAEVTGEVMHLVIENGGQCLYIDKVTGERAIQTGSALGWRRPLYCTGVGKVLLAYLPQQRCEQIIRGASLKPFTPYTITDPDELLGELAEVKSSGVAYDREEIEIGLRCVAVPVTGVDGRVLAAISIAGPANRFGPDRLPELCALVRSAAEATSRALISAGTLRGSKDSPPVVKEVHLQG